MNRISIIVCFVFILVSPVWAKQVYVDGVAFSSLNEAVSSIKDGSRIYLEKGIYTKGAYIRNNDISIIGEAGVVFDGAVADGKAALVLSGKNVLVESIECVNIEVSDQNGACIRFEGENLTARDIYVHDSQSGVMTSTVPGKVVIEYSRFEKLGNRNGYAHALYVKADEVVFRYSSITSTKNQGSGIKSRSKRLVVEHSLLASLDGEDSRLIDMANYGELIVRNSVLQQGNNSSNSQLIAYGLEKKVPRKFELNRIELVNNLIFFDRTRPNVLISYRLADEFHNTKNMFIGDFNEPSRFVPNNEWYISRERSKLPPYPYLPGIDERQIIMDRTRIIGIAQ